MYVLIRLRRKVLMPQRHTLLWAIRTNMTADARAVVADVDAAQGSKAFCLKAQRRKGKFGSRLKCIFGSRLKGILAQGSKTQRHFG